MGTNVNFYIVLVKCNIKDCFFYGLLNIFKSGRSEKQFKLEKLVYKREKIIILSNIVFGHNNS